MADTTTNLLRRLARPAAPPPPLTPARALRLAMVRAAEASVGLPLAVLGIREEEGPLDDLLGRLEEGLLILALHDGPEAVGLVALDAEARAAVIEAQALGRVSDLPSEPRPSTGADAALARPLIAAFLSEAAEAVAGTPLDGWLPGARLGDRLPRAREAALRIADGPFRAVRLTLDLGPGGRQGLLVLMLRIPCPAPAPETSSTTVEGHVLRAQASVTAVLHRIRLPLEEAERLEVGQVLPLPGVTVASVRLEAGGIDLGPGRLGQVAGMRAVRFDVPLAPQLDAFPSSGGAQEPEPAWSLPEPAEPAGWALPEPGGPPDWAPQGD